MPYHFATPIDWTAWQGLVTGGFHPDPVGFFEIRQTLLRVFQEVFCLVQILIEDAVQGLLVGLENCIQVLSELREGITASYFAEIIL